jgi:hypothetical protein
MIGVTASVAKAMVARKFFIVDSPKIDPVCAAGKRRARR